MSKVKEKSTRKKPAKINKKTVTKKNTSNTKNTIQDKYDGLKEKHLRLKAEFENFRRRKSEEVSKLLHYDGENMVRGFLPIFDDFERILGATNSSEESLSDGIKLVQSKIIKYFEVMDIKPFGDEGEKMDPNLHDAMLTQKDEKKDEDVILNVFEKGYTYRDKVIRHAKVIVNKK